jgi:hypothetical protein
MANSGCIFGPTGSFKTTQIKRLARYIADTTGKSTVLISTDGGGWAPCLPEIKVGMIIPYRVETSTLPMFILRKLSQGYWPQEPEETRPDKINMKPIDWTKIGGCAVEGWTSISELYMGYLPDKGISVGGEDRNKLGGFSQGAYVDGNIVTEHFRSNTRGDYREVQKDLYGLVQQFNSLPFKYVLYTALEARGKDEDGRMVYGPAIAGQKATGQCGPWVGDLIHAQDYQVVRTVSVPDPQDKEKMIPQQVVEPTVRYYFKRHLDPDTNIPFPAKPRLAPEVSHLMEKRFPGGYFEPKLDGRDAFDAYLHEVDRLTGVAAEDDSLKRWRERADEKLGRKTLVAK